MNEDLAIKLLAEANPVRADDLSSMDFPDSILGHRWLPRRGLVGSVVVVTAAVAASLIGAFVFAGSSSPHRATRSGQIGVGNLAGPLPTVVRPLGPGAKRVSLARARSALGVPIVLPSTSLIRRPDVGRVWMRSIRPETVVAVTFPRARVFIDYETGVNRYYDDVLLLYRGMARSAPRLFHVIDLGGVPALASRENSDDTGKNFGAVMFDAGGARVTVFGHYHEPTLVGLARSIVDRSQAPPAGQLGEAGGVQLFPYVPPANRISLADASATLGAPVVLPDSPLVQPSDAGAAWTERTCPASDREPWNEHACWVWVSFRSAALNVGFLRPPMYPGNRSEWELQAKDYGVGAEVVDLNGVPALAIREQGPFPGSVEFDLGGNRIVVAGDYDLATLKAAAQSIVDRYPAPRERAPIVAQPTPTFARPLGVAARRITLAEAAATLGAPIVLPYRGFAHVSDVGAVWGARHAVAVTFPRRGLLIRYERPAYPDPIASYESFERGRGGATIVYLNGTPGLEVGKTLEFVARGTIVAVTLKHTGAPIQRIAKSILTGSRSR